MARAEAENLARKTDFIEEGLFELQCLIKATGICLSAFCELHGRKLLAFTTENTDLILHYRREAKSPSILKRVLWFQNLRKTITALCFDPSGSWLLAASIDGSLHIIPALALVDESLIIDHRWAINDITSLADVNSQSSYSRPTSIVWWQGEVRANHLAVLGTEEGEVVLINLEIGQQVGCTHINEPVTDLHVCRNNSLDTVFLLITGKSKQQWRLILEKCTNGYICPIENEKSVLHVYASQQSTDDNINEDSKNYPRSRLQSLKQLSVEKLTVLKQKLAECRTRNLGGSLLPQGHGPGTDEIISCNSAFTISLEGKTELLNPEPLSKDIFLIPQYTRQGQHLYMLGYHQLTSHVTVIEIKSSAMSSYAHKMPESCYNILLTRWFFFVTDLSKRSLYIVSCPLSKVDLPVNEASKVGPSIVGHCSFDNAEEVIKNIYWETDRETISPKEESAENKEQGYTMPKKVEDIKIDVPPVDTCTIITNLGVYKVVLRQSLVSVFMHMVLIRKELEKARKLAYAFGLNTKQLFEYAGDILLMRKEFPQAVILYKLSKCRLLKSVLKFASAGQTSELLTCLTEFLTPPSVTELPMATRIHLSNLSVLAFTELTLRAGTHRVKHVHNDFLYFLSTNTFYDELLAVSIAGKTNLWKILHHLATQRGLYAQVLEMLMQFPPLKLHPSMYQSNYSLLICVSEPNLIQALLSNPVLLKRHVAFVAENLSNFHNFFLQRLLTLYDPTNPVLRPLLIRYRSQVKIASRSSQSSLDSCGDFRDIWLLGVLLEQIVHTFVLVLTTFIHERVPMLSYNPMLMKRFRSQEFTNDRKGAETDIDFKRRLLSAGFSHAALIRNGNVYTWGGALHGCLGTGPSISRYASPRAVGLFHDMEVEILSVSCGRCHTLAVTNNGVYTWGGSQFGQLGLGKLAQSPSPELITCLAQEIIVDAVAGQYHSVALTVDGRVFTWGWGVHGQLGHGNTDEINTPTLVTALLGVVIKHVSAGHAHTIALSAEGYVYGFGSNIFGQLGNGNNMKSSVPIKISLLPEKISLIATGYFHNLAISETNKLYTWGASPQVLRLQAHAQKKSKKHQATSEKKDQSPENINQFKEEPSDEIILKDVHETEFSAGSNNDTQMTSEPRKSDGVKSSKSPTLRGLSVGLLEKDQSHLKPALVDTSLVNGKIVQISTGCHHSALLTKDGSVYTWGRNLDGQIGNGNRREVPSPTPLNYNAASVLVQVPPRSHNRSTENKSNSNNENGFVVSTGRDDGCISDLTNATEELTNQLVQTIKTVRICCGSDFTVAVQPGGTVLAWGSNTLGRLGRPPAKDFRGMDDKLVLLKASKRVVRVPHASQPALDTPSPVPNIPSPIISYECYDVTPLAGLVLPLTTIEKCPGEETFHYVLEQFHEMYDSSEIMEKCTRLGNYQACSKLALLEKNYGQALGYQLRALDASRHVSIASSYPTDETLLDREVQNAEIESSKCSQGESENEDAQISHLQKNTELFDRQVEQNIVDHLEESVIKSKIKMPASKSLDSFQVLEQELHTFDCQGGSEELYEDISEDSIGNAVDPEMEAALLSQWVGTLIFGSDFVCDSLRNKPNVLGFADILTNSSLPGTALTSHKDAGMTEKNISVNDDRKGNVTQEAIDAIKFYINEVEGNDHAQVRDTLANAIDFWSAHSLSMQNLENIFLEYMGKLFYPMGLLLFCPSDGVISNIDETDTKDKDVINSVSTKFCLHVCSVVLGHIDQGKPTPEYVKMLSQLVANHYGPPLTGYPGSDGNETAEQMMEGVTSTISENSASRPFVHITDPDQVSRFVTLKEDAMVFTCGHHFPLSVYRSEIIPGMEAELLMAQPMPLPSTAQLLGNVLYRTSKPEMMCPLCIPSALQAVVKNIADR
ncbi:uncharacterized protein LOC105694570 [Orussus abietinus]|uniref:uncharacterized protein LOC105694570 n=1 Tax=Orussus abietinus TaxID=222816 RepID=UPI000626BCAF|nr:uncharacterized protein LOC105694570 [Orussus abietinus]XP_012270807.1 uncharacterized protein LOC105694570 [Orussus abietinus]